MLILSRRKGEEVYLNDNIKIVVKEVRNGRVQLAFDAPLTVAIKRGELLEKEAAQKDG